MVLVGHSAGGQLVAWAASQPWAHGLRGGGLASPAASTSTLTARLGLGDRAAQSLMGGDPEGPLPTAYAAGGPGPALPRHAGRPAARHATTTVLPEVSRSYEQRMRARRSGSPEVRLTMVAGGDHFGLIDPEHPAFATVLATVRTLAS